MSKCGNAHAEYLTSIRDSLVEVCYFDMGMSGTDISKIFGISKQRVSIIIKRLILNKKKNEKR